MIRLVEKLRDTGRLDLSEYEKLIKAADDEQLTAFAAEQARKKREPYYGNKVYTRGLIEVGNVCKNDCLYCGIRRSNHACDRYVLSEDEIMECCREGYSLGFRTFVLQSGEGTLDLETILRVIEKIRAAHPDCAITLSLGEYPREAYQKMYNAGANRYLLRHETADKEHYQKLHPASMSFENRMRCLRDLKEIGFQVGCGFMVGSPYQTTQTLAKDLKFIEEFQPEMCGIGPFVPQKDTPLGNFPAGTAELTIFLLSLIRLIRPNILLPATTALGTVDPRGREKGVLAGANVVMPNLSPVSVRKKYELYDNKICTGEESAQCRSCLSERMKSIGYNLVTDRGDINTTPERTNSI